MPRAPYDENAAELAGLLGASFADRSATSPCRIVGLSGVGSVSSVGPWLLLSCTTVPQCAAPLARRSNDNEAREHAQLRIQGLRYSRIASIQTIGIKKGLSGPRVTSFQTSR